LQRNNQKFILSKFSRFKPWLKDSEPTVKKDLLPSLEVYHFKPDLVKKNLLYKLVFINALFKFKINSLFDKRPKEVYYSVKMRKFI
jgi:hypothetical protein